MILCVWKAVFQCQKNLLRVSLANFIYFKMNISQGGSYFFIFCGVVEDTGLEPLVTESDVLRVLPVHISGFNSNLSRVLTITSIESKCDLPAS